ncbi:hypothetical protein [Nannocystis bainbridge]|uniref:Secreted protein n=1 Tax=Nannocystis bainbridge TaxID=2995303 RepID=A0ABT5E320_9BACT|nr:hypothetical protein [Nannocystis bainbridge]MDC0720266.1 hypothetical protein [Nannocystis bainbridge]
MQREGWSTWILASATLAGGCCPGDPPSDDGRIRHWLAAGEQPDESDGVPCSGDDERRAGWRDDGDDEPEVVDDPSCDGFERAE